MLTLILPHYQCCSFKYAELVAVSAVQLCLILNMHSNSSRQKMVTLVHEGTKIGLTERQRLASGCSRFLIHANERGKRFFYFFHFKLKFHLLWKCFLDERQHFFSLKLLNPVFLFFIFIHFFLFCQKTILDEWVFTDMWKRTVQVCRTQAHLSVSLVENTRNLYFLSSHFSSSFLKPVKEEVKILLTAVCHNQLLHLHQR